MRLGSRTAVVVVILMGCLSSSAFAQKPGGGGGGGGGKGQQQQGSSSPAGGDSSAQSPGVTGGGSPIESTIFAYQGLLSGTQKVASLVSAQILSDTMCSGSNCPTVLVLTPADMANVVEWRVIVGQLRLIKARAGSLAKLKTDSKACKTEAELEAENRENSKGDTTIHTFVASPTDVQTVVQTVQSLFSIAASNQNVTSSPLSLTDGPLVNMMARRLSGPHIHVLVPNAYTPNVFQASGLDSSFLQQELDALDAKRAVLVSASQECATAIAEAVATPAPSTVHSSTPGNQATHTTPATPSTSGNPQRPHGSTTSDNPAMQQGSVRTSASVVPTREHGSTGGGNGTGDGNSSPPTVRADTTPAHNLAAALGSGIAMIDAFENSLFAVPQALSQGSGSPSNLPGNANPSNGLGSSPPAPASSPQTAGPIQQALLGDLLMSRLWGQHANDPDTSVTNRSHILVVHALEGGGEVVTKSNIFLGSRTFFGGGSVATFMLMAVDGTAECSGIIYGYQGDVKSSDAVSHIADVVRRMTDSTRKGDDIAWVDAACTKPKKK